MKYLVIAAHPDDEVLGCGGTILRLLEECNSVDIAILGEGITSRYDSPEKATTEELDLLRREAKEVADLLGINNLYLRDFPDNRFDSFDFLDVVKVVEEIIDVSSPEAIYTHHAGDLNLDHKITNRAVITATRPLAEQKVNEIYTFEVPSSTEWNFGETDNNFTPAFFVGIEETLKKKIEALKLYKNEVRQAPHPRSPETVKALARWRGSMAGLEAAEAFKPVRIIRGEKNGD